MSGESGTSIAAAWQNLDLKSSAISTRVHVICSKWRLTFVNSRAKIEAMMSASNRDEKRGPPPRPPPSKSEEV